MELCVDDFLGVQPRVLVHNILEANIGGFDLNNRTWERVGGCKGEGVGSESDEAESEDASTTVSMIEEISNDLELRELEPLLTGRDGFPQMVRLSLVVRGERAPKLYVLPPPMGK